MINLVIDLPFIGEVEEQFLFVRLIDIVADRLEDLLLKQGMLPWQKPLIEVGHASASLSSNPRTPPCTS